MGTVKIAAIIMGTPLAISAALIAGVIASGGTFGQRCDRAFPHNDRQSEVCTYYLAKGDDLRAFGDHP